MKNSVLTIILTLFFFTVTFGNSKVVKKNKSHYFSDRIIVKIKDSNKLEKSAHLLFEKFGITQTNHKFPLSNNSNSEILNNIFTFQFSAPYEMVYVLKEFAKLQNVEWAEPQYLYETSLFPNDPSFTTSQQYLNVIKAQEAWDVNTGNEEIIIAIVDTGIDWEHPDLAANIWTNTTEIANNGIDDDGNGYIDDIRGWDFGGLSGTADNNPKEDRADHGTLVAGLASAVTNNEIGIASIGYRSKLMAVKTAQDDIRSESGTALIAFGYEGIVYAVNNGAKIINCSWGGNSFSHAAKAVIDYAISNGALVVAAAGNDNSANGFYPADYLGVLTVAATDNLDQRAWFSNYGNKIDVCAPGVNIYSTWQVSPFYHTTSGTSLSSPIVAGLAALVANQFPSYTPLQIAEQIRVNSDNIDNLNPSFAFQLGAGRINAYKSLTNSDSKSLRISDLAFIEVGDGDGIFEAGEKVKIIPTFTNYLNSLANLVVTLETNNPNVQIENNGGSFGSLNTLQTIISDSNQFRISINSNSQDNIDVNLKLNYLDGTYQDFEWITISINPTYEIQSTENLSITFSSNGSIGFDDFPTNLKGNGLRYMDGPNLMFEGALIYGTSDSTIVNCARDITEDKDNDFNVITPIKNISDENIADNVNYSIFNDTFANPKSLGIETEFYSYSFSDSKYSDFMFVRYTLNNKTNNQINNFYIGQFYDFDIDDTSYDDDMVAFDNLNNFGYAYDDNGDPTSTYIGLAYLSEGTTGFFAMDAEGKSNPTISYGGFSDAEKWTSLTSGKNYPTSGPNDISLVISSGPFSLLPNVKQNFDFLIAAGNGFDKLTETVLTAKLKYSEVLTDLGFENNNLSNSFELAQNYPNPFNPITKIQYTVPKINSESSPFVVLKIYDILGRELKTLINTKQNTGNYEVTFDGSKFGSGIYFYTLNILSSTNINTFSQTKKMLLLK